MAMLGTSRAKRLAVVMTMEAKVRAALQLGPRDYIEEVGVFPQDDRPPDVSSLGAEQTWEAAKRRITESDLVSLGAERKVSLEPRIGASLPRGKAKRVDDVPGVIILEEIPVPKLVLGPVTRAPDGSWVADTRSDPAVLVMETGARELAIWGEGGRVRLFTVERLD